MKRFVAVIVAGGLLAACGGATTDTVLPSESSVAPATTVDTTNTVDTTTVTDLPTAMKGPLEIPAGTASAVTGPPAAMTGVNSMHDLLRTENSSIRFGTQANPAMVTLGPTDGGEPSWPAYETKHSLNIKMPKETPILAPLDLRFIGFKNRSAEYRQDTPEDSYQAPFDDLKLCFESVSDDWPGLVLCVYHLYTTQLLQAHLDNEACGIQERWDGGGAEAGRIYYEYNSTEGSRRDPESCQPLLGSVIDRGGVIGYSGQVGNNPHSGFEFKVRSLDQNPLTTAGDPYLHWVQPSVFFYWQCFEPDAVFQPGVLAYPFGCEATTTTTTTTLAPAAVFKPSLEKRYEVSVEEAVVYGTGGTLDGGQVDLLLDLAVPDTETGGPRPLLVHIHSGGFTEGSRWPQWDWAARGWVAASIDYRLAGDDPLPGPRVQGFFDAVGGKSAPAVHRSVVAAVEDTLVALDYLLGRADELHIDTDRIVLKGESAGAFTALHVAYCADEFGIDHPAIAAVVDFSGAIARTCGEGAAIDPGEAALFVAHGTEDVGETAFSRAENIVAGATAAGITYEFHPLEGVGHSWLLGMFGQTAADGRKIDDLMYEFLDRVLYGGYVPTTTVAPTTTLSTRSR
jgi:acetyl esterase/lipase